MHKMAVFSKVKPHSDAEKKKKNLSFYNKSIEKPKVKRLKTLID